MTWLYCSACSQLIGRGNPPDPAKALDRHVPEMCYVEQWFCSWSQNGELCDGLEWLSFEHALVSDLRLPHLYMPRKIDAHGRMLESYCSGSDPLIITPSWVCRAVREAVLAAFPDAPSLNDYVAPRSLAELRERAPHAEPIFRRVAADPVAQQLLANNPASIAKTFARP